MSDAATPAPTGPSVLAIDIGGSHVKIRIPSDTERRRFPSGPTMTPQAMVEGVLKLAEGWNYDCVSVGLPAPILGCSVLRNPANLGPDWVGFDYAGAFGKPTKLVNDAAMQAVGSYVGGRMLFLGLGTGLGSCMVDRYLVQPMELAHAPYRRGKSYEDYVGERSLEKRGKSKWRKSVEDVVAILKAALLPDYVVLGGGNTRLLKSMPEGCLRGDNANAFEGGFRLWQDAWKNALPTKFEAPKSDEPAKAAPAAG